MSKIGSWVLEIEQRNTEVKHAKPYDRHGTNDKAAREYYVDYIRYRNQHQP